MSANNKAAIFKGWPKTTINKDKKEVVIEADYLTPAKHKLIKSIEKTIGLFVSVGAFITVFMVGKSVDSTELFFIFLGIIVIGAVLIHLICSKLAEWLKTAITITFGEKSIRVLMNYEIEEYDRSLPHTFHLEYNEQMEIPVKKKSKKDNPISKNSYQVYMKHFSGNVNFPAMHEKEKADALFKRVLDVDEWMTKYSQDHWQSS